MKSHVIVPPEPGRVVININGQTVEVSALADALVNAGESLRSLLSPAEGTGQPTNRTATGSPSGGPSLLEDR